MKYKNQLNEFINADMSKISGDKPVNNSDNNASMTNKTSTEIDGMVREPSNILNRMGYGIGYSLFEDQIKENILPIREYEKNDVFDKEDSITLPDIYSIDNINLVTKLKSLITLVNNEDKESDKVAIFADFIKKVNLNNISTKYKKELLKLLKEKL
jgi:hypothetical protein